MKYKMTNFKEGAIAVYDEHNSIVAVSLRGESARILFLDRDSTLLKIAEKEALKASKMMLEYDFNSADTETKDFLKANGYKTEDTGDIYALNIEELFTAGVIEKAAAFSKDGLTWIPFRDLMSYQALELTDVFRSMNIMIGPEELLRFNSDLSGVVYEDSGRIAAFDLVSEVGSDLLIECLTSAGIKAEGILEEALAGMAKEAVGCEIQKNFDRLLMLYVDDRNMALAKKVLGSLCDIGSVGNTLKARKLLTGKTVTEEIPEPEMDYDAEISTERLIAAKTSLVPFQDNINWKLGRDQ